jgi:hypothetical protein
VLLAIGGAATAKPKIPADAPYCARPGTKPTFLSPMGEPFRAGAGQPYPSAAWFAGADRNGDGALDAAEMTRDARRFFEQLDSDRNGRLTPDEVTSYERTIAPEIALYAARRAAYPVSRPRKVKAGESGYWDPIGAGQFAWLNIPQPVSGADADIDRVVTEQEFAEAAARRFALIDKKGAGRVRLAELPPTPAQVELEGPCRPLPSAREEQLRRDRRGYD